MSCCSNSPNAFRAGSWRQSYKPFVYCTTSGSRPQAVFRLFAVFCACYLLWNWHKTTAYIGKEIRISMSIAIQKTRVFNPARYLYALQPGDDFYIATPLTEEDYPRLEAYGLQKDTPARIPIPTRSATLQNADGKWKVRRDLPKEPRYFTHTYHIIDWHGTSHSGICCQERMCYPRELIPPTELAFVIEGGVLYSPLLTNTVPVEVIETSRVYIGSPESSEVK